MTDPYDPTRIWDAVSSEQRQEISDGLEVIFEEAILEEKNGFTFVPHEFVRQAVIDATGNQFSWHIDDVLFRDDNVVKRSVNRETGEIPRPTVMIVIGTLSIPGLGARSGIGANAMDAGAGEDAAYKGAESDAFKRAAMAFGVGLKQLYIEKKRAGASRQSAQPRNRSNVGPTVITPVHGQSTSTNASAPASQSAFRVHGAPPRDQQPPEPPPIEEIPEEYLSDPFPDQQSGEPGAFIPPTKDGSGKNVWTLPDRLTGAAKASDRQLNWIFDLLYKLDKNPYQYDWHDLDKKEASEWIDQLQQGRVPFE